MRTVLLALSMLAAGTLRAQVLQGGFATYVPKRTATFEYHFYWFENGRFIHTEHGCTGAERGAGTYQLRGDSLWLRFDGPPSLRSTTAPDAGTTQLKLLKPSIRKPKHLRWTDTERGWNEEFEALTPLKTAELLADYEQLRAASK